MLLESAALMFLLHSIAAFALHFSINSQWLRVVLFRRVLLPSHDAGVSLLRVDGR